MTRLGGGERRSTNGDAPPDFVVPLAGAYVIAASEWLDFEGAASPAACSRAEQEAQRTAHIEAGADRAFILTAALPVEPDERVAALYRTLLLAGLAELGHKQTEFRHWLRAHDGLLFPPAEDEARWDLVLLRRVVELWTRRAARRRTVGPRARDGDRRVDSRRAPAARTRVLRRRSIRPTRRACASSRSRCSISPKPRPSCCSSACTASRERVEARLYSHFTLARDAAGGDPRLDASFDWLYEASRRVVAQRTSQLELLPERR